MTDGDICFLDTETLGLDPAAPVWEFAAMRCTNGFPVRTREFFIHHDPGNWVETLPESFQQDYHDRYKPLAALDPDQAAEEIHFITNGAALVGCNLRFDMDRIDPILTSHGIVPSYRYHLDDIASMVAGFLAGRGFPPLRPWKSNALSLALGVDPDHYARHTAMGDVRWTQAQYQVMFGGAA